MLRTLIAVTLLIAPAAGFAQSGVGKAGVPTGDTSSSQSIKRIRSIQLTKGQTCPKGTGDEIIVCSPVEDPYRIPKSLRNEGPIPAKNQSWVNRAAALDEASRVAGGLPDTCSVVGTGGQSGCALQQNRAYAADRRARAAEAASIP